MNKISSDSDIEKYLFYFEGLNKYNLSIELDRWEIKIRNNEYNKYEFLTFLKILDLLECNISPNDVQTIGVLKSSIDELNQLSDYTLDNYLGTPRQKDLLDNINKSITECEMLYKYYNEKIIN